MGHTEANRLVFKFQFDVDSDGELEHLKPSATVMNLLWRDIYSELL
jgi:hypothetical protein